MASAQQTSDAPTRTFALLAIAGLCSWAQRASTGASAAVACGLPQVLATFASSDANARAVAGLCLTRLAGARGSAALSVARTPGALGGVLYLLRRARARPEEADAIHLESLPALYALSTISGTCGARVSAAVSWSPGTSLALSSLCSSTHVRVVFMAAAAIAALATAARGNAEPLLLGGCAEAVARLLRESSDAGAIGAAARALTVLALARGGSGVGARAASSSTIRRLVIVLSQSATAVAGGGGGGDPRWRSARADAATALANLTFVSAAAAIAAAHTGAVAVLSALLRAPHDEDFVVTRAAATAALSNITGRSALACDAAREIVSVVRCVFSSATQDVEKYAALGALANGLEGVNGEIPVGDDSLAAYWGLSRGGGASVAGASIIAIHSILLTREGERCAAARTEDEACADGRKSLTSVARNGPLRAAFAASSALGALALSSAARATLINAGTSGALISAGVRGANAVEARIVEGRTQSAALRPGKGKSVFSCSDEIVAAPCDTLIGLRALLAALAGVASLAESNESQRGVLVDAGAAELAVRAIKISLFFDAGPPAALPSSPAAHFSDVINSDGSVTSDSSGVNFCARYPLLASPLIGECERGGRFTAGSDVNVATTGRLGWVSALASAVGAAAARLLASLAFTEKSAPTLGFILATASLAKLLLHSNVLPRDAAALALASIFALLPTAPCPSPWVRAILSASAPALTTALAISAIVRSSHRRESFLDVSGAGGSAIRALVNLVGAHADAPTRSVALVALRRLACGGGARAGAALGAEGACSALSESLLLRGCRGGAGDADTDEALVAMGAIISTGGVSRTRAALEGGPAVVSVLRSNAAATRAFAAELLAAMSEGRREFLTGADSEGVCDAHVFLLRAGAVSAAAAALLAEREQLGCAQWGGSRRVGVDGLIGEGAPRESIWAQRTVRALRRMLGNIGATAALRYRRDAHVDDESSPAVAAVVRTALCVEAGGSSLSTSRFAAAAASGVALWAPTEFECSGGLAALLSAISRDRPESEGPLSSLICSDCSTLCKGACAADAVAWRFHALGNALVSGGRAVARMATEGGSLLAVARIAAMHTTRPSVAAAAFSVLENALAAGGTRVSATLSRAPDAFVRQALICVTGAGARALLAARFLQAWTATDVGCRALRAAAGGHALARALAQSPTPSVACAVGAALCNISKNAPRGNDARATARVALRQPPSQLRAALGAPHADAVARSIACALSIGRGARARRAAADAGLLRALAARALWGAATPLSSASVRALAALSTIALDTDAATLRVTANALACAADSAVSQCELLRVVASNNNGGAAHPVADAASYYSEAASIAAVALRALATHGALSVSICNSAVFREALIHGVSGVAGASVSRAAARAAAAVARVGGAKAAATLVFGGGPRVARIFTLALAHATCTRGRIRAPSAAALAASLTSCRSRPPCDPQIHSLLLENAVSRLAGMSRALACAPFAALAAVSPSAVARAFNTATRTTILRAVKIAASGGSAASRALMRAAIARAACVREHDSGGFAWSFIGREGERNDGNDESRTISIDSAFSRAYDGGGDDSGSMAAFSSALVTRGVTVADLNRSSAAWGAAAAAMRLASSASECNASLNQNTPRGLPSAVIMTLEETAVAFIRARDAPTATSLLIRFATLPRLDRHSFEQSHHHQPRHVNTSDAIVNAAIALMLERSAREQVYLRVAPTPPPFLSSSSFSLSYALIEIFVDFVTSRDTADHAARVTVEGLRNASSVGVVVSAARAAAASTRALCRLGAGAGASRAAFAALTLLATARGKLLTLNAEGAASLAAARTALLCAGYGATWLGGGDVVSVSESVSEDSAEFVLVSLCASSLRDAARDAARSGTAARELSSFTDAASAARAAAGCLVDCQMHSTAARGVAALLCAAFSVAARTVPCAMGGGEAAGVAIAAGLRALLVSRGGGGGVLESTRV